MSKEYDKLYNALKSSFETKGAKNPEKLAEKLASNKAPLSKIAYEMGYKDGKAFSKMMKETHGES